MINKYFIVPIYRYFIFWDKSFPQNLNNNSTSFFPNNILLLQNKYDFINSWPSSMDSRIPASQILEFQIHQ